MKKLIFAVIACALVAGPAMADDFAAMQTEKLDKIATKMEQFKNNPKVVEFLTEKKDCVTKATDADSLKACVTKYSPEKIKELLMK